MGSVGAMTDGSADRYFQDPANNADKLVPEGIEGRVPDKGSVIAIIYQVVGGIRASMGYCGCATMEDMRSKAEVGEITSAGRSEEHPSEIQSLMRLSYAVFCWDKKISHKHTYKS